MTAIALTVTERSYPWPTIKPQVVVQGDAVSYNVNLTYATLIASSGLTDDLYKDGKLISGSPLTGSPSATGSDNNVITSVLANTLLPGEYVLFVSGTVDGQVRCACQILIRILQKGKAL